MDPRYSKRIEQLAAGLFVLSKYDPNGSSVCAEHDQVWAGPSLDEEDSEVGYIDKSWLLANGWVFDDFVERWTFFL